jgi:hypothetical protein
LSEVDTAVPQSEGPTEAPRSRSRVKLFAFLITIVAFGGLLFWLYKSVKQLLQPAEDVGGILDRLTHPRRKRRHSSRLR